eukprot:scaffold7_cov414-Pavlova_lutheri.AAC.6
MGGGRSIESTSTSTLVVEWERRNDLESSDGSSLEIPPWKGSYHGRGHEGIIFLKECVQIAP